MPIVHIFIADKFALSEEEVSKYINASYTEDGDQVDSHFMSNTGLTHYEPCCIELQINSVSIPLSDLLAESSYADQWISKLPHNKHCRTAVCVYEPNIITNPLKSKLDYVGCYNYKT